MLPTSYREYSISRDIEDGETIQGKVRVHDEGDTTYGIGLYVREKFYGIVPIDYALLENGKDFWYRIESAFDFPDENYIDKIRGFFLKTTTERDNINSIIYQILQEIIDEEKFNTKSFIYPQIV